MTYASDEKWRPFNYFFSRAGLRNYQHPCIRYAVPKEISLFYCLYRVIHKSLRDFRPLRYSSRDGHAEGEHVNRGTDPPRFCPTLQVLDMSTLGNAVEVNPVIKLLPHSALHLCVAGT